MKNKRGWHRHSREHALARRGIKTKGRGQCVTAKDWQGLSKGMRPSDFDPVQLRKGIKVEMEHTRNPQVARRIAMDHLTEDPDYYIKLEKMVENG